MQRFGGNDDRTAPAYGQYNLQGRLFEAIKAMERAKEIQANLSPEHPSFIKVMQRSHVLHPFYMCPPADFCQRHLPRSDEIVVLEVESGQSYDVKFLGMKRAFSGRWKHFSVAEKLLENDILVFHLVGCCKFKVHIVRASGLATVDKAPRVVKSDDCATEKEVEKKIRCESDKKSLKFVPRENMEVSDTSVKKSICPNKGNSSNMEESNLKNSEKMRGTLDKNSIQFKASPSNAMKRAKEIQANLSKKHPSFIKLMLKSHLSRPFYMSPPTQFCQKHLPSSDGLVVFEVERQSYDVKFLGMKRKFSGGWKGFVIAEELLENDILVFHLVEPCIFKVYIVRASGLVPVDKFPTVINIDDDANEKEVEVKRTCERDKKRRRFVPVEILREDVEVSNSQIKNSICANNSYSSNVEDFPPSQTMSDYKDFKIIVNGSSIEFPQQVQADYFKLCRSRNSYLHRHLIKGIDHDLAASIISEMVSISNAIRESKIYNTKKDMEYWYKALDGFEAFGMDVGFIRARLNRLSGLVSDSERYKEAEIERDHIVEQIIELEKTKRRLDDEIEGMKNVAAKFEVMYEEEANAPW